MRRIELEQEQALFEVKEFLISIIGSAPYGILAFDLEGEIIMANTLAIEYLGKKMSVNSAVGKNIMDMAKHIPTLTKVIIAAMRKGREPFDLHPAQINNKFILIKGRLISTGTILVLEDISSQKKAEDELYEANIKLQELDRMKSMFIASMSHELRTPLNSIIGYTGLILMGISGEMNEDAKSDLKIVYDSSKHLLSLINDVIDISKIEADQMDTYSEKLILGDVIEDAVKLVLKDADEKKLKIKTDYPKNMSMVTDRKRLLQCILNLMSNAVKFTKKGIIELRAITKKNTLEISVRDTGIGIKKADIPKLFHSFIRLKTSLKEITPGTGLGLYLTKKIMTSVFNGDIRLESHVGKGSTFTLIIPLNKKV